MCRGLRTRARIVFRPLPAQISGLIARDPAVGGRMLIDASHPRKRRVQTAAHEAGHVVADRSHADLSDGARRHGRMHVPRP